MFAKVNAHIAPKNSDYTPTADTTALEALILDENDHGTAQGYFRTLINNGAMTTSQAGACVARELEHELHGRTFGYTSTEGVNRVMNLCHDRNVRLEVESQLAAKHPELKANEGSITRAYLADDGWNPQEVDQFDANWVANNAYTQATYKKDENGYYSIPVKAMVCSCGTATPKSGVYKTSKGYEWGTLEGGTFGRYSTRIIGGILFHSVPYTSESEDSLEYWEYDKLGTTASLGCVRLSVADTKWIFDNCEVGTQVEFYTSSDPGPLGKPTAQKISDNVECRNWDPTDTSSNSPWNK